MLLATTRTSLILVYPTAQEVWRKARSMGWYAYHSYTTRWRKAKVVPSVVTGASDGIGKEFALQLAKAGFNIVLVARNKAKLEAVAADIGEYNSYFCGTS